MTRRPFFRPYNPLPALALLLGLLLSTNSFALELGEAKQNGWVGEQFDGYLGSVHNTSEVRLLVQSVNRERQELYRDLAVKHGLTLEQVAQRAGQRNISRTERGLMVETPDGTWMKK